MRRGRKPIFDASQVGGVNTTNPKPIISRRSSPTSTTTATMELVFGTNETYGSLPNASGRMYAYEADGSLEPGWPVEVGPSPSPSAVPLVADGAGTSPVAADIDGDGTLEIAIGVLGSPPLIFNHDGTQFALMNSAAGTPGGAGDDGDEETPEGGLGVQPSIFYVALGAFADLEGAGALSYLNGTIGAGILPFALGGGALAPFDFHLSAWDATSGAQKPAFPRVLEDWQFFTGPAVADLDGGAGRRAGDRRLERRLLRPRVQRRHGRRAGGLAEAHRPLGGGDAARRRHRRRRRARGRRVDALGRPPRLGHAGRCVRERARCRARVQWRKALHDEWGTGIYGRDTLRPAAITDLAQPADGDLDLHAASATTAAAAAPTTLRGALAARHGDAELGRRHARGVTSPAAPTACRRRSRSARSARPPR